MRNRRVIKSYYLVTEGKDLKIAYYVKKIFK